MGVEGLLKSLKSITSKVHLNQYQGKTAGIDAYGWLHRGVYGCSLDIVQGKENLQYVHYCLQRIELLQQYNIRPILIFDGAPLPAKARKNQERQRIRDRNKTEGLSLLQEGKGEESWPYLCKATGVTYEMELKRLKIEYYVAPYEADAQLAYFSKHNWIDFVISEDSDCLPYGCKMVFYKLTKEGFGEEIKREDLGANMPLSFLNWTDDMFLAFCVLAGCDYCPSIKGLGIMRSYKLVAANPYLPMMLKALHTHYTVPEDYDILFQQALWTFQYQRVYDPLTKSLVTLRPLDILDTGDLSFLGPFLDGDVVQGIADASLHPTTHQPYHHQDKKRLDLQKKTTSTKRKIILATKKEHILDERKTILDERKEVEATRMVDSNKKKVVKLMETEDYFSMVPHYSNRRKLDTSLHSRCSRSSSSLVGSSSCTNWLDQDRQEDFHLSSCSCPKKSYSSFLLENPWKRKY